MGGGGGEEGGVSMPYKEARCVERGQGDVKAFTHNIERGTFD